MPPGDSLMSGTTRPQLPGWLMGSSVIAVAMAAMNVSTYGFTILAARLLGPREYGALAAVMGLLLVINVASLGLQATGARRVSASPRDRADIESEILSASYRSALILGALCLLAVPVVTWTLRLDSWTTAALLAVAAVPLTVMGGQAGILQGERRWRPLAGIYLAMGLGRVVFGVIALLMSPHANGAMVGVALGAAVPVLVGWLALKRPRSAHGHTLSGTASPMRISWARGGILREVSNNSHALLAFFALSNADVIIARLVLDDYQSGLYAGGLILAKAVLFLPQFVVVIAFPSMSAEGARRNLLLAALLLVLGIGALATGGAWVLSGVAVVFIGGAAYAPLESFVWAFAAIGTLLAMTQLMVYGVVARQHKRAVFVVWAGLLILLGVSTIIGSVTELLAYVASVEASVLIALLLVSLRSPRTPTRR